MSIAREMLKSYGEPFSLEELEERCTEECVSWGRPYYQEEEGGTEYHFDDKSVLFIGDKGTIKVLRN